MGATMDTGTGKVRLLRGCAAAVTGLLLLLPAAPAFAHGGGDSDQSRVLVLDALSYLANKPSGYMDEATDKIGDALEAPDAAGVDLTTLKAAQQALKSNDMMRTRTLLQAALQPMSGAVTGEDPGTSSMPDPLTVHTGWAGSGVVSAALAAGVFVLAGLLLAWRWRPAVPLRALRAQATEWSPR